MKIRLVGAVLVYADGWTDKQKAGHEEGDRRFSRISEIA
jgi:hypothetical protein